MRLFRLAVFVAALSCGLIAAAIAQEKFPVRPVELIVPRGPGGGADQLARSAHAVQRVDRSPVMGDRA